MESCRERLMRDIRATVQRDDLELQLGSWMAIVPNTVSSPEEPEETCAELAATLQDQHIIEYLGEAWPRCLAHGRHPMTAVPLPDGTGVAMWQCPHDSAVSVPIGELRPSEVDEPYVPNGVVRWWADELGFGVIADEGGDVWVHFTAIEGFGFKSLTEGQSVELRVAPADQGAFRKRAEWVRPL